MNKLLAVLVAILILLNGAMLYVVAGNQTGGKGGTTNADSVSLNGSLTLGADNNGNGVTDFATRQVLTTASTTPCAILSPSATTTLVSTSLNIASSSASISNFTLATSTTAYATTSLIASISVAANAKGTPNWDGGVNNSLVSPNTYIVWGVGGGAVFNGGGTCNAVFRSVI